VLAAVPKQDDQPKSMKACLRQIKALEWFNEAYTHRIGDTRSSRSMTESYAFDRRSDGKFVLTQTDEMLRENTEFPDSVALNGLFHSTLTSVFEPNKLDIDDIAVSKKSRKPSESIDSGEYIDLWWVVQVGTIDDEEAVETETKSWETKGKERTEIPAKTSHERQISFLFLSEESARKFIGLLKTAIKLSGTVSAANGENLLLTQEFAVRRIIT